MVAEAATIIAVEPEGIGAGICMVHQADVNPFLGLRGIRLGSTLRGVQQFPRTVHGHLLLAAVSQGMFFMVLPDRVSIIPQQPIPSSIPRSGEVQRWISPVVES
jgi:hypothetical protein